MAGLGKYQISHIEDQRGPRRDNDGALDHILEFSYVSRPMISAQGIHCCRGNRFDGLFHASSKLLREVPHQERNIPLAFPQGWNVDWENIQPKEEIGPELLLAHHSFQMAVCRGNQTRIGPKCARASQPLELPLLQHAKEFGLQFERNFSNFVQENRAPVSHFEAANALRDRSRKCAFLVSEQLAFQQARRYGRAVELHEGLRSPRTQIMNAARDKFFSRACFSVNQDRRVRWRYSFHLFEDSAQRNAISDDLGKIHFRTDFIFQIQLLFGELVFQLSNLTKRTCILHCNGNLICDLGQKRTITCERILLIFDHTECSQHATSANKRKDADRSNFGLRCVLHSELPRLLDAAAPKFAGAKDHSRDIFVHGNKALFVV